MGGAVKGVVGFVKQAGKEITGDAERERVRAARDAQRRAQEAQDAALKEVEDQKAKEAAEEKAANDLLAAKKAGRVSGAGGRRSTMRASATGGSVLSGSDREKLKTLLGG